MVLRVGRDRAGGRDRAQPRRNDRRPARSRPPGLPERDRRRRPGPIDDVDGTRERFAALADSLDGEDGRAAQRRYVAQMPGPGASEELAAKILDTMCSVPLPVASAVIRGVVPWDGAGPLARCAATPFLVIRSDASDTDEPARLRRHKPDIEYGITVGAAHFNHLEAPEQVNGMIERFLALPR